MMGPWAEFYAGSHGQSFMRGSMSRMLCGEVFEELYVLESFVGFYARSDSKMLSGKIGEEFCEESHRQNVLGGTIRIVFCREQLEECDAGSHGNNVMQGDMTTV